MSIQDQITRLNTAKRNILTSLSNKDVNTSNVKTIDDIPSLIDGISTKENLDTELTTQRNLLNNQSVTIDDIKIALQGKGQATVEDLSDELNTYETYLNTQETTIDDIMTALQGKAAGGDIPNENIFSNDYSQIGYMNDYITATGYSLSNVLWSDLEVYTGQTSTWYVTNPIPIESATYYKYEGFSSGNNPGCCFLGEDKVTVYNGFVYKGSGVFYTPEEAKYIVMTVARANIETMSVMKMTEIEIKVSEIESLIKRTITRYSSDTLTSVGTNAFHNCTSLNTINLPNATTLNGSAFNNCTALTSVNIPNVTSITTQTFYACHALTTLDMPKATNVGTQAVRNCKKIARIDLGACTTIGALAFDTCPALNTCIVRTTSKVCSLANVSAFTGTLIASGTGYIYVPDDLVDSYKSATNWSTYSSQIKGLSELEV